MGNETNKASQLFDQLDALPTWSHPEGGPVICGCGRRCLNPRAIRCAECRHARFLAYLASKTPEQIAVQKHRTRVRQLARRKAERAKRRDVWADILASVAKRRAA